MESAQATNVANGAKGVDALFRQQFRVLRRAAGLSQTELARRLGTTRQRLSRWEKSKIDLTPSEEQGIGALTSVMSANARCASHALKRCWDCERNLAIDRFSIDRSRVGGRRSRCRECSAKYLMAHRRTSGIKPRRTERTSEVNRQLLKRDFEELLQLGDGFHFVDVPVSALTPVVDADLQSHPLVRRLKNDADAGRLTIEQFQAMMELDDVQEILESLKQFRRAGRASILIDGATPTDAPRGYSHNLDRAS